MDTETLLNTVLDYPYLIDIYTYDSTIMGIEFLSKEFNGAAVLLDRNDLAENLLSNYTSSTATIVASEAEKSVGHKERIKLKCMEALLAYPKIYDELSQEEKEEVVANSLQLADEIDTTPISKQQTSFALVLALDPGEIIEYGLVMTPLGSEVEVFKRQDWTADDKVAIDNEIALDYPNATKLATATYNYNCHSYAWYKTSGNTWWMDFPDAYMDDGSYSKHSTPKVNDKIYWEGTHSGIVKTVSGSNVTKVYSKWGACGLYSHARDYCPYPIVLIKTYWGF